MLHRSVQILIVYYPDNIATIYDNGVAKGGSKQAWAHPTFMSYLPKCLICPVIETVKDQYTPVRAVSN